MHVLAIDTSTPAVVAGLCSVAPGTREVTVLASRRTVDGRAHAEVLSPQVAECLSEAGLTAGGLDAVVVGRGPGPFTGLRVGMVTGFALAHAAGVPVIGVCGLDAIADQVRAAGTPGTGDLLVVTDARRREAYTARYSADGERIAGPEVRAASEIDTAGVGLAVGDATRLAELGGEGLPRESAVWAPAPDGLVRVALREGLDVSPDGIRAALPADDPDGVPSPLYLRRPDAVEPRPRPISPALVTRTDQ